jgi:hypothetical protein
MQAVSRRSRFAPGADPPAHLMGGAQGSRMRLPVDTSVHRAAAEARRESEVDEARRAADQLDTPDHDALDRQLGRELAAQAGHLGAAASGCSERAHMRI